MAITKYTRTARPRTTTAGIQPVLYVEDEDVNWQVAERNLRKRFRLTRAVNAKEAFEALRKSAFAAVLMDIQLSGSELDGIEIVKILRGRFVGSIPAYAQGVVLPEKTPIIFVTAYSARYGEKELVAAGGTKLLTKPVDFVKLSVVLTDISLSDSLERLKMI